MKRKIEYEERQHEQSKKSKKNAAIASFKVTQVTSFLKLLDVNRKIAQVVRFHVDKHGIYWVASSNVANCNDVWIETVLHRSYFAEFQCTESIMMPLSLEDFYGMASSCSEDSKKTDVLHFELFDRHGIECTCIYTHMQEVTRKHVPSMALEEEDYQQLSQKKFLSDSVHAVQLHINSKQFKKCMKENKWVKATEVKFQFDARKRCLAVTMQRQEGGCRSERIFQENKGLQFGIVEEHEEHEQKRHLYEATVPIVQVQKMAAFPWPNDIIKIYLPNDQHSDATVLEYTLQEPTERNPDKSSIRLFLKTSQLDDNALL
jgi:hypothetical protein